MTPLVCKARNAELFRNLVIVMAKHETVDVACWSSIILLGILACRVQDRLDTLRLKANLLRLD